MSTNPNEELGPLNEWVDTVKTEDIPAAAYDQARRNLLERLPRESSRPGISLLRHPLAAALTAALAVLLVVVPFMDRGGQAFAKVAESLNRAVTIAFSAEMYFGGSDEATAVEMAFREPGLQRITMTYQGAETVQINDTVRDRGLILVPMVKTYVEVDLRQMPDVERERTQLIRLVTEELRGIPDTAEEVLESTRIDGVLVRGYRVGRRVLWIDEDREELVQVDLDLGGARMVMNRFRFDPPGLHEGMFSVNPPEGYVSAVDQSLVYDPEDIGEADLVDFLRFMALMRTDAHFPSAINPLEVLTLHERGLMREDEAATQQEVQENGRLFARASQRSMGFVMGMGPDRDWHYAGEGVELGAPDTPIAWWIPEGADAYRVVWADLSITDELDWQAE